MCVLCLEIVKGHITYNEAYGNMMELVRISGTVDELSHYDNLLDRLIELEAENYEKGGTSSDKIINFQVK